MIKVIVNEGAVRLVRKLGFGRGVECRSQVVTTGFVSELYSH